MLDVFNNTGKGLNIDQPDDAGQTILHICAMNGDDERVTLLIGQCVCVCVCACVRACVRACVAYAWRGRGVCVLIKS